jgi:hypothetical protein
MKFIPATRFDSQAMDRYRNQHRVDNDTSDEDGDD